jgi:hypothetical protein
MRQKLIVILEHMCYHFSEGNNSRVVGWGELFFRLCKGGVMRLLRLAVEIKRWDLAAHTIVLASARVLKNGDRPNASRSKAKKRRPKG